MPDWTNTVPGLLLGGGLVAVFTGFAVLGVLVMRSPVRRVFGPEPKWHELVTLTIHSVGTFYGLLLALIAFAAYGAYAQAGQVVSAEAASLSAMYRAVSGYPDPLRSELQDLLGDYIDYMITEAWPAYQRGVVAEGDTALAARFGRKLYAFDPQTNEEKALNDSALAEFEHFNETRRLRHNAVNAGLPRFLWAILLIGAVVVIGITWLFPIRTCRAHMAVSATLAVVIALLIFVVAALDEPFRGELSVSVRPLEHVRDDVMTN